jgi:hypothetical protein
VDLTRSSDIATNPPDQAIVWSPHEFENREGIAALAARARESLAIPHHNYDIEWLTLSLEQPGDRIFALADEENGRLRGILGVRELDPSTKFGLGGTQAFRKLIRQFVIYEGVVTRRSDVRGAIVSALTALAQRVPRNAAVFVEAVPVDSEMHAALEMRESPVRQAFHVLPWRKTNWRYRIRWSGSVETYLKSLGQESRRSLTRYSRKLLSDAALRCEVKRFASASEADQFMRDGMSVSDKTYQKKNLGLGLSLGGRVERQIKFAAARGNFIGHILYINDTPAAFQYGFVHGETCYVDQIGYDPAWASRHVGGVLLIEVLRQFERTGDNIKALDFGQGMTVFKERTTNERRAVRDYYLFKRTLNGFLLYHSAKWMSVTAGFASDFLERMKLKGAIRAVIRRGARHGQD